MANIGFGLDINETAQSSGFDQYKLSLSENKTKLTSTFDKLNESKKDLAD